jgi:hypothetical protein
MINSTFFAKSWHNSRKKLGQQFLATIIYVCKKRRPFLDALKTKELGGFDVFVALELK